jgi:hypothetical protein
VDLDPDTARERAMTAVALLSHPAPDTRPEYSRRMVSLLLDGLRTVSRAD